MRDETIGWFEVVTDKPEPEVAPTVTGADAVYTLDPPAASGLTVDSEVAGLTVPAAHGIDTWRTGRPWWDGPPGSYGTLNNAPRITPEHWADLREMEQRHAKLDAAVADDAAFLASLGTPTRRERKARRKALRARRPARPL